MGQGAERSHGESSGSGVLLLSALYAGYDPDFYRWWDRWQCWAGQTARGFDFHAMGLPRGRHNLPAPAAEPAVAAE